MHKYTTFTADSIHNQPPAPSCLGRARTTDVTERTRAVADIGHGLAARGMRDVGGETICAMGAARRTASCV